MKRTHPRDYVLDYSMSDFGVEVKVKYDCGLWETLVFISMRLRR